MVVHGFDTRDHVVYDLDGRPSQLAIGCLLETIAIAATGHGLGTKIDRREDMPDTHPTFDVHLSSGDSVIPDPLIPYIERRTVQRRPMSWRSLTQQEKSVLEKAV